MTIIQSAIKELRGINIILATALTIRIVNGVKIRVFHTLSRLTVF